MKFLLNFILFCALSAKAYADIEEAYAAAENGDLKSAYALFLEEAEAGNGEAMLFIATILYTGAELADFTIEKNPALAQSWMDKAVKSDFTEAKFLYGTMLMAGQVVEMDQEKAFINFLSAAKEGHAQSQLTVGLFYMQGTGPVNPYPQEGAKWILEAAKNDNLEAQYMLGAVYQNGLGVAKNPEASLEWLKTAAKNGHPGAIQRLTAMNIPFEADEETLANGLYEQGAMRELANRMTEAIEFYEQAAEYNNKDAQYNLGVIYLNGKGVPVDFEKAQEWFMLAAKNGDMDAHFNLGMMLVNGDGVPQDLVEAASWFIVVKEIDPTRERGILDTLYPVLTEEELTLAQQKANEWMSEHAIKSP